MRSWDDFGKWLVPPADKRYLPWCTFVIIAGVICIFFFMAGEPSADVPASPAQQQCQGGPK